MVKRSMPALAAAALMVAALAGAGQAAAAAHPGRAAATGRAHRATAGIISTVAGGVGGPGIATKVAMAPCSVSFGNGNLYIADVKGQLTTSTDSAVREVDPSTGMLTTPAGTKLPGPLGNGGPATAASLGTCGTAVDQSGNLVIADFADNMIRVVAARAGTFYGQAMKAGDIYTVAGDGRHGYGGDGGPALRAKLRRPQAVAVDANGNLVIADTLNSRIRVVAAENGTFYGVAMTAGDIYTVAGDGGYGFSGDGGRATSAELDRPLREAVDANGNLVIADTGNNRIRVVAASTGTFYGQKMTTGHIYTVAGDGGDQWSGDGLPARETGLTCQGVAVDATGNLIIADVLNQRVRVVAARTGSFYGQKMTAGDIYTIAGTGTKGFSGDGGPATKANFRDPAGVTVDNAGNVVIADSANNRVRVVAARAGTFYAQAMTAGDVYAIAGTGTGRGGFSGDGGPATSAETNEPVSMTTDHAGNMVFADLGNERVRVVAASTGTFYGQKMTAGDVYTVAGNGHTGTGSNGLPATHSALNQPEDVKVDHAGNLVIADTRNEVIRVVAVRTGTFYGQKMTAGDIYAVAGDGLAGYSGDTGPATSAELDSPDGVAVDAAGNLMIADTANDRVRVVAERTATFYGQKMTAGHIYSIAGTGVPGFSGDGVPALGAELDSPTAVKPDKAGNLLIADSSNQRVRVIAAHTGTSYGRKMKAGYIYTVAGDGTAGFSGDGGKATSAELAYPGSVTVDAAGNLLIADEDNDRVRAVAESTGTFYGVAMKAGDIYTVAGDGTPFYSGDGGPATKAGLTVRAVAIDAGNLLIADGSLRIRMVTG
jgi:trimeric autotransporter adhesin